LTKIISLNLLTVLILLLGLSSSVAETRYFPAKSLSKDTQLDQFLATWYSGDLKALKEPSLLQMASSPQTESYRFLWLRTFHHPVSIRLDIKPDGSSVVTKKITNGRGGYAPGALIENSSRPMTTIQTKDFLAEINESQFWSTPAYLSTVNGNDGSEWIIEGIKGGKYHVVARWAPKSGTVYELGRNFLYLLGQMIIPKGELY